MTLPVRLIALGICVLLLAPPVAVGCGGAAMMAADCPMVGMDEMAGTTPADRDSEMANEMATLPCHERDGMDEDCCDVEQAPEPVPAPTFDAVKLLVALEATDLPVMASLVPSVWHLSRAVPDILREYDVGRYTLFSSFLL